MPGYHHKGLHQTLRSRLLHQAFIVRPRKNRKKMGESARIQAGGATMHGKWSQLASGDVQARPRGCGSHAHKDLYCLGQSRSESSGEALDRPHSTSRQAWPRARSKHNRKRHESMAAARRRVGKQEKEGLISSHSSVGRELHEAENVPNDAPAMTRLRRTLGIQG